MDIGLYSTTLGTVFGGWKYCEEFLVFLGFSCFGGLEGFPDDGSKEE